ncbi:cupin domain-containing protein [Psychrilyobacter atlanticus]|uniref:cupin domain-containing protein n=1 Tax=Psychrilyobacter atlanticus TaxID=271091 RepID=UPI00048B3E7B|nr:cupin domain-containing protein [Psychrilyobacter atlanticus]
MNQKELEILIKKVIEAELGNKENSKNKYFDPSGIGVIKANKIEQERFDTGNPNDEVYVTDLFSLTESPRIGAGMMEMKESTFDWTLNYDEIDYIIEGTLKIIIDGREIIGEKGDVMLIPKGSKIKFSAPDYAKFIYVVYPANWQEQN